MVEQQRIGRGRQTLPVLTPHQWAVAVISGVVFGVLLLWHLTLVITAGVPLGGLGITLRGLLTWSALALSHSSYQANGVAAATTGGPARTPGPPVVAAATRPVGHRGVRLRRPGTGRQR